jgi:hypothetical protein
MKARPSMTRILWSGIVLCLLGTSPARAQTKGQWLLGSYGLNAGVFPVPGFTYSNQVTYHTASRLNDGNGNAIAAVTGSYTFWVDLNQFQYVPKKKILGGYYRPYIDVIVANGKAVADIAGTDLSGSRGGSGLSDTFVAPVAFGWHIKHADLSSAYAFTAPTGRFAPGATNNVGSGFWGNNLLFGATGYLTPTKSTSANLFFAWEGHGEKKDTETIPGQAVTMEWGLGQVIPLDKQLHQLLQVGLIGYDQWQASKNSGITSRLPAYAVSAIGLQANYVLPATRAAFFLKGYDELSARARTQGRTLVFGGSWTHPSK